MIERIKSYFVDQPATYLDEYKKSRNDFFKNVKKDKRYNFGNKNKNKIFYVINRSPGAGFFSNLTFVLNYISYAIKKKYIPIVDMQNFPTIYNETKKIFSSLNSWEYYFKKINKYKLSEVYQSNKVIFSPSNLKTGMSPNILDNKEFLKIKKKIEIKDTHKKIAKSFIKKNFTNDEKILGVHLRGTTYKVAKNHPFPVPKEMMLNLVNQIIKKEKITKVFLSTEEEDYLEYFKKNLKKKLVYFPSYRTKKVDSFKIYPRKFHRYNLGREILIEMIILSQCKNLVFVNSNVIDATIFFSNINSKKYEIFLGNNSNNKFVARQLWTIKKILPAFMGGFNNNISINKLNKNNW